MEKIFFYYFLLFHQLADDEALIMFLQASQFLVFPYAVDNCMLHLIVFFLPSFPCVRTM